MKYKVDLKNKIVFLPRYEEVDPEFIKQRQAVYNAFKDLGYETQINAISTSGIYEQMQASNTFSYSQFNMNMLEEMLETLSDRKLRFKT